MRVLKIIIPVMLILIRWQTLSFGQAQTSANIKGYVQDGKSGETLPYANVTLLGSSLGTSTNQQGYFVLVNVPTGPCTLRVHYIGYQKSDVSVIVQKNTPAITVKMKATVLEGDEVLVTAETYETVQIAKGISELKISP